MATIKEDAFALLNRIPEDKLYFLVEIMRGLDGLYSRERASENSPAFQKLVKLCRPIPDLDEEKELASWREEKFGHAGVD